MAEELLGFETVELRGQLVDVLRQRSDQRVCHRGFQSGGLLAGESGIFVHSGIRAR